MHHIGVFYGFVQYFLIRFGELDVVLFHEPVYGGGEVERRNHHIPFPACGRRIGRDYRDLMSFSAQMIYKIHGGYGSAVVRLAEHVADYGYVHLFPLWDY